MLDSSGNGSYKDLWGGRSIKGKDLRKKRERKRKSSRRKIDRGSEEGLRGGGGVEKYGLSS